MPTVRIRFPGGRYHATTWGHHVNEGQIEWPPSPWRLLRALMACGFNTQQWLELPDVACSLFEKLCRCLPSYRLPSASAAHSRHFMPIGTLDKGREKTTLVFDTWANVSNEELIVRWECILDTEETELLRTLVDCLGYLGRSESWIEAELLDNDSLENIEFNAFPHSEGRMQGRNWEQITSLAAIDPDIYQQWRNTLVDQALSEFPLPDGKKKPSAKLIKDRERVIAPYPTDILECLQKDTSWWKQHRWSQPPGSQRVVYWRRSDSLEVGVPQRPKRPRSHTVSTMILAITTPSGNKSALPSVTRTLPQAELVHRALVGRVAKGERVDCPELTGKSKDGKPLLGSHEHAHIIPIDLDNDGHLDHIIIHVPMGLGDQAQSAIRTLTRTWTKGGTGDLQLALAGCGDFDSLRTIPAPLDRQVDRLMGSELGSTLWTSITPFVPPRYVKPRGKNSLIGQIAAELNSRGFPEPEDVQILEWNDETLSMRHFVRVRRGKAPPPIDIGYVLQIRFAEALRTTRPLILGYASHFGLGLFGAIPDS